MRIRGGIAAVVLLACQSHPPAVVPGCSSTPVGKTTLEVREARAPSDLFPRPGVGGLTVRVGTGAPPHGPLVGAIVRVDTARSASVTSLIRGATTDSLGRAVLRDLPAGNYNLTVRRIGLDVLRRRVRVRSQHLDTVRVTLATKPVCLSELGATPY